MAGRLVGLNGKLYYKVGGFSAGGSWVEVPECQDLTFPGKKDEDDVTTRGGNGWSQTIGVLKAFELHFGIPRDSESTIFQTLLDSWLNGTVIGFRVLDQTSGQGPQADCEVMEFPLDQPLRKSQNISVVVKATLSDAAGAPTWYTGA